MNALDKYLSDAISEGKLRRIKDEYSTVTYRSNSLLFINRKLGLFYVASTRSPLTYYKSKKSSMKGTGNIEPWMGFTELAKATLFEDWEIYQSAKPGFMMVNVPHMESLTGLKYIQRVEKHVKTNKLLEDGVKYKCYEVSHPSIPFKRFTIQPENLEDREVARKAMSNLRIVGNSHIGRNIHNELFPRFEEFRTLMLGLPIDSLSVRVLEPSILSENENPVNFGPITKSLNREELIAANKGIQHIPLTKIAELKALLLTAWFGIHRESVNNFTIKVLCPKMLKALPAMIIATNGNAGILKKASYEGDVNIISAYSEEIELLWKIYNSGQ